MMITISRRTGVIACVLAVIACTTTTRAQPTDNAALFYYQAFLLYEPPEGTTSGMLDDYRNGKIAINDSITEFIEKNRSVIGLVVKAGEIDKCDWGHDYSQGVELTMPNLARLRRIAFLLAPEIRWLADRGDFRAALDRCITMRRMAMHTCDKTIIGYLVGTAIDALAYKVTEHALALVPNDTDALRRFRSRLLETEEQFPSLSHSLTEEAQLCTVTMWKDKAQLLATMLRESSDNAPLIERVHNGDDEFFKKNREYYLNAVATITSAMKSDLPYAQIYDRLSLMSKQWSQEAEKNTDATLAALSIPDVAKLYLLEIRRRTHLNAIVAAIDLYAAKAQTGHLPDTLAAESPLDLFSGKPFLYEKTPDGFVLRCQARQSPEKTAANQYEFKVRQ